MEQGAQSGSVSVALATGPAPTGGALLAPKNYLERISDLEALPGLDTGTAALSLGWIWLQETSVG